MFNHRTAKLAECIHQAMCRLQSALVAANGGTGHRDRWSFFHTMSRRWGWVSAVGLFLAWACLVPAFAVPAANLVTAPLRTPSQAQTFYGTATTHTNGAAAWAQTPPEIKALARSLGAERLGQGSITSDQYAQNVLNYVRNNIAVEFRYGLGKGARGALIDQSGTPFDQAELMVKLLREGNVSANYQIGTISLSAQQFGLWTGLVRDLQDATNSTNPYTNPQTFNVDAKAACQFLADGGIPAAIGAAADCSGLSGNLSNSGTPVVMSHIWLVVGSSLYDPSFKLHILKNTRNLPAMMGCGTAGSSTCGSQVDSAAMTSATTGTYSGSSYIQNMNVAAADQQNKTFAIALQNSIQNTDRSWRLEDVVGGKILYTTDTIAGGTLLYTASMQTSWDGGVGIPDQYRTTLNILAPGLGGITLFADEIAGRRITYAGSAVHQSSLFLVASGLKIDGTAVSMTCSSCLPAQSSAFEIKVAHPYAANGGLYANDDALLQMNDRGGLGSFPVTIVHGFGEASPSAQQHMASLQTAAPIDPGSNCPPSYSPPGVSGTVFGQTCRDDQQIITAETIRVYSTLASHIVSGVTGTATTRHHTVGLVFESCEHGKSHLTVQSAVSVNSPLSDASARARAFEIDSIDLAQAEVTAGADTTTGEGGGSSVGALVAAIRRGNMLLDVSSGNMAAVLTALPSNSGYGTTRKSLLQAAANGGYSTIMADNGDGELFYATNSRSYALWESLKGAASLSDPAETVMSTAKASDAAAQRKKYLSVSPADGALTIQPGPDIVTGTGSFPESLAFSRTYKEGAHEQLISQTSAVNNEPIGGVGSSTTYSYDYGGSDVESFARLGGGWVHNFDITASYAGDASRALGDETALDASRAIASIVVLNDLFTTTTLDNRLSAVLTAHWLGAGLYRNTVLVRKGPIVETFVRLPDGSFSSSGGSPARLVQSGELSFTGDTSDPQYDSCLDLPSGTYGDLYSYNLITFTYTGAKGDIINFDWSAQLWHPCTRGTKAVLTVYTPTYKANSWVFPNGLRVNFGYSYLGVVKSWGTSGVPIAGHAYILSSVSNNLGRSLTFSSAINGSISVAFNGAGMTGVGIDYRITAVTDENGRNVQFGTSGCPSITDGSTQFASGILCDNFTVTDPTGAVTRYEYAADANSPNPSVIMRPSYRLRRWFTPGNTSTPYRTAVYDDLFRVKSITDILGHATRYFPAGAAAAELWRPGYIVDPLGNTKTTYFDKHNSPTVLIDELGRRTLQQYDNLNRLVRTTLPEGNATAKAYDVRGNVISTTQISKSGNDQMVTQISYGTGSDSPTAYNCANPVTCNLPTKETSGRGFVTKYEWDTTYGFLTRIDAGLNANGSCALSGGICPAVTTHYVQYNGIYFLSSVIKLIDSTRSATTSYDYNSSNHYVLSTVRVDPSSLNLATSFTFDNVGNLTQIDGPRTDVTDVTNFVWDNDRRLTMKSDPATNDNGNSHPSIATEYTYDADSQLIRTDEGTIGTGGMISILSSRTVAYDPAGNKVQETTPTSVVQYSYDADDRLLCTAVRMNPTVFGTVPASAVITTLPTSSVNGNTIPDACTLGSTATNGDQDRITLNVYDAVGQLRQTVRGYGTGEQQVYQTIKYSLNGKQIALGDADEVSTIGVANADALNPNAVTQHQTNYTYDGFDRLIQTTYANGTGDQITQYDNDNNPLAKITRAGKTISYTYDALDRIATKMVPAVANISAANTVNWSYDLVGKVTSIWDSLGNMLTNCYDLAGRQTSATSSTSGTSFTCGETPANTVTTRTVGYRVDEAGNRTQIVWPDGSYAVTYSYDAADRMTAAVDNGGVALATFDYDQQGRPAWRQYPAGASADKVAYSWSPESDLLTLVHTLASSANSVSFISQATDYNPAHQITAATISNAAFQYIPAMSGTVNYSPNGLNQYSSVGSQGYGYDLNGNLTSDGSFAFGYDPENRLMTASKTGSAVTYAYDPLGRRIAKTVTGGSYAGTTHFLSSGDDEIAEYDGSGNLLRRYVPGPGIDQPIAMVTAVGTKTFFHQDKTGNVIAMSDASGNLAEGPYTYDPFGNCLTGGVICSGGVPFKYTGRRYDPETGLYYYRARYYSAVIGRFLQTDSIGYKDNVNWYTYVGNDPTDKTDPSGNDPGSQGGGPGASACGICWFVPLEGFEYASSSYSGGVSLTPALGAEGTNGVQVAGGADDDDLYRRSLTESEPLSEIGREAYHNNSQALSRLDPFNKALNSVWSEGHSLTVGDANIIVTALREAREEAAGEIAFNSHSFHDHAYQLGIGSREEFYFRTLRVISESTKIKELGGGRATQYFLSGTTVIVDHSGGEGSMFRETEQMFWKRP